MASIIASNNNISFIMKKTVGSWNKDLQCPIALSNVNFGSQATEFLNFTVIYSVTA